jgi:hypothetical protein
MPSANRAKAAFSKSVLCLQLMALAPAHVTASTVIPGDSATPTLPTVNTIAHWEVGGNGVQWAEIEFDDLLPPYISLQQCWNSMGIDPQGRVYIGFTSDRTTGGEDFAVFRYDPATGQKSFLGSLVDVARSHGNLASEESIPKGHTRLIFADGKIYMGTQGFHDFKRDIDDLPKYRGAHLFAFEVSNNTWEDLSARFPGGVIVKNQGILAMGILRSQHLLVGLTHPLGDILVFNYRANQLVKLIRGIPWKFGNPISRELIVTPTGRIYTYRGTEDLKQRAEKNPVWVYDPQQNGLINTGFLSSQGFWIGQTQTHDGRKIYVSTTNGQLYEFDTLTEKFKDLAYLLPEVSKANGRRISFMYGVTLSPDEKMLYYAPAVLENPEGSGELYSYEIATGKISFVQQLRPGVYATADLRDANNVYMAHFGTHEDVWKGRVRLIMIKAQSLPPASQ